MSRGSPSAEETRSAAERILASHAFKGARRSADLLRYVVETALKEPGRAIKEHELGAEALGRGEKFDARFDPIARVEASRVRARLTQYYSTEGAADPVRIDIPKGGYTPVFSYRPADTPGAVVAPQKPNREPLLWSALGVAAALLAVLGALVLMRPAPAPPSAGTRTFDTALGAPGVLADQVGNSLQLTPDGKSLVMQVLLPDGSTRLFARAMDQLDAKELPGTVGAFQHFVSPDGRWAGFFNGNKIRKTLIDGGGTPVALADVSDVQGLAWGDDGYIYAALGPSNALRRIPENGGASTEVVVAPDGFSVSWPQVLPGAKGLLFSQLERSKNETGIAVTRMDGSGSVVISRSGGYPRYAASGHVLYVDRGTLFAVGFDIETFKVSGPSRPVVRDVAFREPFRFAMYDIASDGTLVYLRSDPSVIVWLDGSAQSRPLLGQPERYLFPKLSPDERRLAFAIGDGPLYALYVMDLVTGARQQIGGPGANIGGPVWSPDGEGMYVTMNSEPGLGWADSRGEAPAKVLLRGRAVPFSLAPDGKRLAYYLMSETTHFDLWTAPVDARDGDVALGATEVFLQTPAIETYPSISPDGKWLAYNSNESGDFDIYVRPFPGNGRPVQVSRDGGRIATWSQARQELFFATNDHRLMVVPYQVRNGEFVPGEPRQWADQQLSSIGVLASYDVAADGNHVVAVVPYSADGERARSHVTVVLNFFDLLKASP
jgi:serine/threonine-protein kinase